MFDIFYTGNKPNLFPFELPAKDLNEAAAKSRTKFFWFVNGENDYSQFDFSWHSVPWEYNFVHVFPDQWQKNSQTYFVKKDLLDKDNYKFQDCAKVTRCFDKCTTDILYTDKYETIEEAAKHASTDYFWYLDHRNDYTNFDFSWHCDMYDQDYIHVFPSQWHANGGVYYVNKKTLHLKKHKFQICQSVKRQTDMSNWIIPDGINISNFDFSWHPNPLEKPYEYHFPTQWQSAGGPIYKGTAGVKLVSIQKVKSLVNMSKWFIPADVDLSEFDFSWHPNPFDPPYSYQFPTQHQRDGGPVYLGTAGIKYCNQQHVNTDSTQIFYMDFLNAESSQQFEKLEQRYSDIKRTRYVDSYLNVFRRIISLAKTEFVWIISSICDYKDFDFTWHPESSQREMIHCFASGNQKRGDTFYINVESFKNQMYSLEILDWFNVINYISDTGIKRFDSPVHTYCGDNLVEEIKKYQFTTPYAVFTNQKDCYPYFTPCLWSEKDRVIESFANSKAICAVPRDAKLHIKTQVYDYPYVQHDNQLGYFAEQPLDIVYISNGEPNEQEYWEHLNFKTTANFNIGRLHWVKGINGRNAAYKEAARLSQTPWFFAVFAKLRVDPNFNFTWQPDYFQSPKHYIFHALNPVNGLEYGHQAMIAYNKQLTLNAVDTGLDFTLSAAHEVVPIRSGVAEFNQDPWMTWRTAFREVIKLKHFSVTEPTVETDYRLKKWLTVAQGQYADNCIQGANDAVEYYNSVNGDFDKLKLSYEWAWLKQYFDAKYQK